MIYIYIFGGLVAVFALAQWVRIRYYARIGARLIAETEKQEQYPDDPARRVLVIGDSLWQGVGAADPSDSLAGRLIADLPDALVVNQAESGARIANGMAQLESATREHGDFDQIIIQLGANDIVNFTPLSGAKRDLTELLTRAHDVAPDVAYLACGSVGFAPIFWQPLDWFYSAISRRYLTAFEQVAADTATLYIDLYRTRENDPFNKDPDKYYAADKFHPSSAGYGVWYGKCRNELQCFAYDEARSIEEVV